MFGNIPPVVKNLLILNIGVFALSLVLYYSINLDLTDYLGLFFFKSEYFRPYEYVTYMFMHSFVSPSGGIEIFHLLFNMFALYMFGRILEQAWGPTRFFVYYIITGLGAAITHTFVLWIQYSEMHQALLLFQNNPNPESFELFVKGYLPQSYKHLFEFIDQWTKMPNSTQFIEQANVYADQIFNLHLNVPVVGASGAVFGILLAFGMMFPNARLMLLFPPIPLKAKYFVIIFGAMELFFGISGAQDNVAHFAHLGGMLFGIIVLLIWRVKPTDHF
jgi:membrane associated rhomboid family serine protease